MNDKYNFLKKIEIDSSLTECPILQEKYFHLNYDYYSTLVLTEKNSGLPVFYSKDLIYNPDKHNLVRFFSEDIINLFPHNEQGTLAYIHQGVACFKIFLTENYNFNSNIEAKLIGIVSNIILFGQESIIGKMLNSKKINLSKNEIYNILLILNLKSNNSLNKSIINQLSSYLFKLYTSNKLSPHIQMKKSIRTKDYFQTHNKNIVFKFRECVISDISKIKSQSSNSKIENIVNSYPGLKFTQLVKKIAVEYKCTEVAAKQKLARWKRCKKQNTVGNKVGDSHIEYIYNLSMVVTKKENRDLHPNNMVVTSPKQPKEKEKLPLKEKKNKSLKKLLSFLDENPGKYTQFKLAKETGLSLRTVKTYWKSIKNYIPKSNIMEKEKTVKEIFPENEGPSLENLIQPIMPSYDGVQFEGVTDNELLIFLDAKSRISDRHKYQISLINSNTLKIEMEKEMQMPIYCFDWWYKFMLIKNDINFPRPLSLWISSYKSWANSPNIAPYVSNEMKMEKVKIQNEKEIIQRKQFNDKVYKDWRLTKKSKNNMVQFNYQTSMEFNEETWKQKLIDSITLNVYGKL